MSRARLVLIFTIANFIFAVLSLYLDNIGWAVFHSFVGSFCWASFRIMSNGDNDEHL